MERHVNMADIPVEVITAAIQGKPDAISYVLNHFGRYVKDIMKNFLRNFYIIRFLRVYFKEDLLTK